MCFATYIVRTSLKYSRTSPSSGTRLMLVNQVALGECCDFNTHQKHLKRAPAGYDSCHGVKAMANNGSDFEVCFYSFFVWVFQRICNHLWVAVDSIAYVLLQHAYMYVKVKDHSLQPSLSLQDDEYAIYDPSQQKLAYLAEYTLDGDETGEKQVVPDMSDDTTTAQPVAAEPLTIGLERLMLVVRSVTHDLSLLMVAISG